MDAGQVSRVPRLLKRDKMVALWHTNGGFGTPHAEVRLFISNRHSVSSPRLYVCLELLAAVVNSKMRTLDQQAKEAGMGLKVEAQYAGIAIQVTGFSHQMELLLLKVAGLFSLTRLSSANFEAAKEWLTNDILSSQAAPSYNLLQEQAKYVLTERVWTSSVRAMELGTITRSDVKEVGSMFMSQVHMDALVVGNISPAAAEALVQKVTHKLGALPSSLPKIEPRHNIELNPPASFVYKMAMSKSSGLAATLVYLDMYAYPNTTLRAYTELIASLLRMPLMNQLRTEEKLTNSVKVGIRRLTSRGGLQFVVESTFDPAYIEARIDSFLTGFEVHGPTQP